MVERGDQLDAIGWREHDVKVEQHQPSGSGCLDAAVDGRGEADVTGESNQIDRGKPADERIGRSVRRSIVNAGDRDVHTQLSADSLKATDDGLAAIPVDDDYVDPGGWHQRRR